MKNLKDFDQWINEKSFQSSDNTKPLNEVAGIALLAGIGAVLASKGVYDWSRKFWSKNVVGSKYKETGKKEKVVTKLPKDISSIALLSKQQIDAGEVVTELKQYKDSLGNEFWGYDHVWSPEEFSDFGEYLSAADLYTALYKEEDLEKLKKFLENSQRYTGKNVGGVPKPIEMIFKKDIPKSLD